MNTPQLYMYDLKTGEYTGSRDATLRPNGEPILEATGATPVALPADIPAGHVARWTGEAWETVEDTASTWTSVGARKAGRRTGSPMIRGVPNPGTWKNSGRFRLMRF